MSRQYKKSIKAWAWQEKMSHRCTCQNCTVCFKRRKAKVAGGSQDASKRWHCNSDTPEMQTHGPSAKYALFCLTTKQVTQQRQRVLASLNGSAGWRKRPQYTRPCSRCAYSTSSNNSMINSLKVWHWCVGYCSGGEVSNNICLSPFMCFFLWPIYHSSCCRRPWSLSLFQIYPFPLYLFGFFASRMIETLVVF